MSSSTGSSDGVRRQVLPGWDACVPGTGTRAYGPSACRPGDLDLPRAWNGQATVVGADGREPGPVTVGQLDGS